MNYETKTPDMSKLRLDWNEARTERLLDRVHVRLARRKWAARGATAAVAIALVGVGFGLERHRSHPMAVAPVDTTMPAPPGAITLHEGSTIALDPASAEVRVVDETPTHVSIDVVRGAARYSVVPNPRRSFEVHAGLVTVTVVGTEFVVEPRAEGAFVQVSRGKVRVSWGSEEAFVAAGESGTFPPSAGAQASDRDQGQPLGAQAQPRQVYRSRVAGHDYRGAYAVLSRHPALAGDTVEDLLVAADVARLSDHPSEALPYLQRIVREHPKDERAPLAAFTLGRTLGGLGRTQEAMSMFGKVRTSWPDSPLAEDALLRQAEAASRMGDLASARRFAEQYERQYPSGRRRAEIRRYAQLD
jgi:transmembrane sensor